MKHYLQSANRLAPKLGIHPTTLRRLARAGEIPHYRFGNRLLFEEDEVLKAAHDLGGSSEREDHGDFNL